MKKLALTIIIASSISGCASMGTTSQQMVERSQNLEYPSKPLESDVLAFAEKTIRPTLKDPDSLKNLAVSREDKCTFAEQNLSGNIFPRTGSGAFCYHLSYQATNSYGGYVTGEDFVVYDSNKSFFRLAPTDGLIVSSDKSFLYDASNKFMLPPDLD